MKEILKKGAYWLIGFITPASGTTFATGLFCCVAIFLLPPEERSATIIKVCELFFSRGWMILALIEGVALAFLGALYYNNYRWWTRENARLENESKKREDSHVS